MGAVAVAAAVAGGVAAGTQSPALMAVGPTKLDTEFTAVFTIGDRTIRQFRYADAGELNYTFTVRNSGRFPVTVAGLAEKQQPSRLLRFVRIGDADGTSEVRIGAGDEAEVWLTVGMDGCETLSARAGSYLDTVRVRVESFGMFDDEVTLELPEELRTGSPREAFCPDATSTSRPRA